MSGASVELAADELSAVAAQMAGAGVDLAGPLTARLIAGGLGKPEGLEQGGDGAGIT